MRSILQIGNEQVLREIRATVLRLLPVTVRTATIGEAIDLLRRERFDLILFCHTVTQERERENLCSRPRRQR
jgi:CheY-like chemotaxis protein